MNASRLSPTNAGAIRCRSCFGEGCTAPGVECSACAGLGWHAVAVHSFDRPQFDRRGVAVMRERVRLSGVLWRLETLPYVRRPSKRGGLFRVPYVTVRGVL